jgi:hypothetical protein
MAHLFKELKMLPYPKLISFFRLNLIHSYFYSYCPKSFENLWPHNNLPDDIPNLRNATLLHFPTPGIELFKKSPLYSLPSLWNELDDIKHQNGKTTFKIGRKDNFCDEIA